MEDLWLEELTFTVGRRNVSTRVGLVRVHPGRLGRRVGRVRHVEAVGGRVAHLATATIDAVESTRVTTRLNHRLIRHATVRCKTTHRNLSLGGVGGGSLSAGTHTAGVMLLDLGLKASAIWGASDTREQRSNGLHDLMLHMESSMLQRGLDDIVAERISKEAFHFSTMEELKRHHVLRTIRSTAQTLLDHIRTELVTGKFTNLALELFHKRFGEGRLVQVDDVLNHIVAKWVLHEALGVIGDSSNQPRLLVA